MLLLHSHGKAHTVTETLVAEGSLIKRKEALIGFRILYLCILLPRSMDGMDGGAGTI